MNPWLQAGLSLLVGLLTAGGALFGVRHAVRGNDRATEQRDLAARREEWWRRFIWAAELALDESPAKRVAGLKLLGKLAQSDLAHRDECLLLDVFQGRVLDTLLDDLPKPDEQRADR
ncbi:hypothetical protein [Amycolatopsis cihanbeyliensis]|uniref:Uncharacterized protein n=1 Tax=Amycolatopsis cihanbeyliensis TaxID=1128664 RepID=A0A542DPR9_AMYCI|nr:hypothetical protein [Amycolatopsis cihanbeyliensis]TQJ05103.1 hypothetical protein FB471_4926 [Amycolatopsis cihanbeyliensis]